MTNEEKKELLIALCGYYPYGVIVEVEGYDRSKLKGIDNGTVSTERGINYPLRLVKPYLRPMESMTDHEVMEYKAIQLCQVVDGKCEAWDETDWLNALFLDYRGLIPRGMALPACEGMYNLKKD